MLVALLAGAGCVVECIAPTTAYRITGPDALLGALAASLAGFEGFALRTEEAPTDRIDVRSIVAPARPYRRTSTVHGPAFAIVRSAVDAGLTVVAAGKLRWFVTGPGAAQAVWLAEAQGLTAVDVLRQWGVTAEALAAEDAPAPVVHVSLPARRVETVAMDRDAEGLLTRVVQVEKDTLQ